MKEKAEWNRFTGEIGRREKSEEYLQLIQLYSPISFQTPLTHCTYILKNELFLFLLLIYN